jgi:hypothetical protein
MEVSWGIPHGHLSFPAGKSLKRKGTLPQSQSNIPPKAILLANSPNY